MKIYDLTLDINSDSVVFPGDPSFINKKLMDVNKGDPYTLCHFSLGNHSGTHIDFPSHIIPGGKTSRHYPLEYLMGKGRVIEISGEQDVLVKHLEGQNITAGEIIFFKTNNTHRKLQEKKQVASDFSAISIEAAKEIIKLGVKIAGIDYLSVDSGNDSSLPIHNLLLQHNVLIVENINLQKITPGEYFFNISPLKIQDVDGLPVRITATERKTQNERSKP